MSNMKEIRIDSTTLLKYQSTTVDKNDDNTYNVKHIFINDAEKKITFEYPRVKMTVDPIINLFYQHPIAFPFRCNVLPDKETDALFKWKIEEQNDQKKG